MHKCSSSLLSRFQIIKRKTKNKRKDVKIILAKVNVQYSDYLNEITDEISFELLTDTILKLKFDNKNSAIVMSMADKITDNTELHGSLDLDGLNTLIKTLTVIRNQIIKKGEK